MHLRIRKLKIDDIKQDEYNVVLAKSGAQRPNNALGRPMKMEPGVLEFWDGLKWWPVRIAETDDTKSPYDL